MTLNRTLIRQNCQARESYRAFQKAKIRLTGFTYANNELPPPEIIHIVAHRCSGALDENGHGILSLATEFPTYPELQDIDEKIKDWTKYYYRVLSGTISGSYDEVDRRGMEIANSIADIMNTEKVKIIYQECERVGEIETKQICVKE